MRIDSALVATGDKEESVKRMKKALVTARKSQDKVQIARCLVALGVRLASAGFVAGAEENWRKALNIAESNDEYDMQQIVGWTLIVKARFLKQNAEYLGALKIAERAEKILENIKNYAGVANVTALMAELCKNLNYYAKEKRYREKSEKFLKKAKIEQR